MREGIKNVRNGLAAILGFLLLASGFVRRAKRIALSGRYITGIAFHNPTKKLFTRSIKWLKGNDFNFVSTQELVSIITHDLPAPRGAVWITLDDGWKDNLKNVIPVVIEYNIPITIFVTTDAVENKGYFWWRLADQLCQPLRELYNITKHDLFCMPETRRKDIIADLETRPPDTCKREAMSVSDVKAIAKIPQVTIGSHTEHHAITSNCSDAEMQAEIGSAKRTLEKWLDKEVSFFAYPNGVFDGREKAILKKLGVGMAATIENRLISLNEDPFLIPRFVSMDDGFLLENICHIVGIWEPFVSKLKKVFKGLNGWLTRIFKSGSSGSLQHEKDS